MNPAPRAFRSNNFKRSLASWAIITLVAVSAWKLFAQVRTVSPVTEIMKQKLDHAQSVLEGLALENFDLIKAHAGKLSALSERPGWLAVDTEEYAQQSILFKRNVRSLIRAAENKNLDAATLAYAKVTFSCIECHKYLRGREVAAIPEISPPTNTSNPAFSRQ